MPPYQITRSLLTMAVGLGCVTMLAAKPVSSLCSAHEQVVFNCASGSKRLSVCAVRVVTESQRRLQLRMGEPGKPFEFWYPAAPQNLTVAFELSKGYAQGYVPGRLEMTLHFASEHAEGYLLTQAASNYRNPPHDSVPAEASLTGDDTHSLVCQAGTITNHLDVMGDKYGASQ